MFAIYGISGPIFQGTLETLSQIPPVTRRGPANRIRSATSQLETGNRPETYGAQYAPGLGAQATEAYQAMLPRELDRGPLYHAEQIMHAQVISVRAADDVAQAWRTLVGNQIHQAPVLDAEHHLVGIVSERDLLTTLNVDDGKVRDVLARKVSDVMTTPVVAATPTTDIRRIARVMLEHAVDGVPITSERGTLLGFISRTDILRAVVTDPPLSIWR
jgi:acetoin utilization protein AcuB